MVKVTPSPVRHIDPSAGDESAGNFFVWHGRDGAIAAFDETGADDRIGRADHLSSWKARGRLERRSAFRNLSLQGGRIFEKEVFEYGFQAFVVFDEIYDF